MPGGVGRPRGGGSRWACRWPRRAASSRRGGSAGSGRWTTNGVRLCRAALDGGCALLSVSGAATTPRSGRRAPSRTQSGVGSTAGSRPATERRRTGRSPPAAWWRTRTTRLVHAVAVRRRERRQCSISCSARTITPRARASLNDGNSHLSDAAEPLPPQPLGRPLSLISLATLDVNRDGRPELLAGLTYGNPFYAGRRIQDLIGNGETARSAMRPHGGCHNTDRGRAGPWRSAWRTSTATGVSTSASPSTGPSPSAPRSTSTPAPAPTTPRRPGPAGHGSPSSTRTATVAPTSSARRAAPPRPSTCSSR